MSITFRVLMILACAYAGWETANFQLATTARTSATNANEQFSIPIGLTRNEETKASR